MVTAVMECTCLSLQMVQVFESHAGILGPELFATFSLPYLEKVAKEVKRALGDEAVPMVCVHVCPVTSGHPSTVHVLGVPQVVFAKGAHYALEDLAGTSYDVIGLDWTVDVAAARARCGGKVLQGNMDPCALYAPKVRPSSPQCGGGGML